MILLGVVVILAGVILSSVGCWYISPNYFRYAGVTTFCGAFSVAIGMGLFHGWDFLEREKIDQEEFPKR